MELHQFGAYADKFSVGPGCFWEHRPGYSSAWFKELRFWVALICGSMVGASNPKGLGMVTPLLELCHPKLRLRLPPEIEPCLQFLFHILECWRMAGSWGNLSTLFAQTGGSDGGNNLGFGRLLKKR